MKTIRLGKGLNALIPQQPVNADNNDNLNKQLIEAEVSLVKANPYQPRVDFDPEALKELIESIREKGIIQPITVRRANSHYELIAGERRLRAVLELGIEKIPAYVVKVDTKEEMLEMAIIENVQREKLNPIEQAIAFQRLITECNLTQDDVAKKIGKDRTTITNLLRLLKLPADIQGSVKTNEISVGHARTLVSVEDNKIQKELWKKVIRNGLSVRKLEKLVKEATQVKPNQPVKTAKKSVFIQSVEEKLRDLFGTKVVVRSRKEGGSVEIDFYSPEDLNRLLEIFDKIK